MAARREPRVAEMSAILRALADPTRLRILGLLRDGEVCVCHIHEALEVPQPTASRHLAYLRRVGLVAGRRDGLWVHYRLAPPSNAALATLVASVTQCAGQADTVARDRRRLAHATGCAVR